MKSFHRFVHLSTVLTVMAASGAEGSEATLYISPQGNDAWSGKLAKPNFKKSDGPLASLDGARAKVREQIAKGPSGPVTVLIRGGRTTVTRSSFIGS